MAGETRGITVSSDARRRIRRTLVTAVVMSLLLSMRYMGFMAALLAMPLAIWLAYSVYVVATRPERRRDQLIRVGIWIAAFAVVGGVHAYLHLTTRAKADETAAVIARHLRERGACPEDLAALGLEEAQLKSRLGMSIYRCESGKPTLAYAATFVVFEMYRFDFANQRWVLGRR